MTPKPHSVQVALVSRAFAHVYAAVPFMVVALEALNDLQEERDLFYARLQESREQLETLREFAQFVVTLDDPRAIELRRSINLVEIIRMAEKALGATSSPASRYDDELAVPCQEPELSGLVDGAAQNQEGEPS